VTGAMSRNLLGLRGVFYAFLLLLLFSTRCGAQTSGYSQSKRPLITQPVDESNLVVLGGNTHPLALPQYDQGPVAPDLPLHRMLLVLKRSPAQELALDQLLNAQQDKSSSTYHQWVTPQQFGQLFGPTDQDVQSITTWLGSHGFQVTRVANGRSVIEFSGTAEQVVEAFHTSIHKYLVNGEQHLANTSDPQIPAALAPAITGVCSLHNFFPKPFNHFAGAFHKNRATGKVTPAGPLPIPQFVYGSGCGILGGPCEFLGPYDLATIYNILPLWNASTPINGSGETIAIVAETDVNPSDWTNFWNFFGVSTPEGALNIIHDGPDPGILQDGEEAEADIDTQWSSAVAKGATIDLVVSESTETSAGTDLSAEYIVDNNLAAVMSESYGACELFLGTAGNAYFNALWQQASAQGISVFLAAGDSGSAVCDRGEQAAKYGVMVSGYSSTPYDVAVGGTDFNDLTTTATYWNASNGANMVNAKGHIPELTWNDTCTNSEIFPFLDTTTAEQTCNNSSAQEGGFLNVTGGSGGASTCTTSNGQTPSSCSGGYSKPTWQTGTGVPNDHHRDVPDVSLFASNGFNGSGYIVCESDATGGEGNCIPGTGNFLGYGGTSVSSPAFAGIMALVDEKMGGRQGNPNYVFYQMAAGAGNSCNSDSVPITGANSCIFYDVPSGSTIAMPCVTGSTSSCVTSTSGDDYGVLSGYATTTGYDQATGLGSVNVANLVNNWNTYAGQFKGSEFSSFTLGPPTTIAHGQSIAVAATVVSQSGTGPTPTGSVALVTNSGISSSGQLVAQQLFPLTNGSIASGTTTIELSGGTNESVTAHYSGDANYAPSDSSPVTVTVNPEPSKTFANLVTFNVNGELITFSASGATYGSGFYFLRVDVGDASATYSPSSGISSNCSKGLTSCPTGTVRISGTPLNGNNLPLNIQGFAENQSPPTGSYALALSYPGDSSYGPSSTTANFTIAKAKTTAAAGTPAAPVQYGQSEEIAAQISTTSNGAEPTGTFSFFLDGSPLSTSALIYEGSPYAPSSSPPMYAYLDATGTAVFPSGSHSLTVQYSGDAYYAASMSPPVTFTVTKGQPEIASWGATPSTINLGQQTALSAQLFTYGTGASPTGTMIFYDNATALPGTVTYTSEPEGITASMTYIPTTAGTHNITVSYSGDANYLPTTTPIPAILTVIGPTFSVSASPATIVVSSPGATGSSTLTFTSMTSYAGSIPLSGSLFRGLPSGTTCSFNVMSVTLASSGSNSTQTAVVTCQTTASSAALPQVHKGLSGPSWLRILAPALVLAMIVCLLTLSKARRIERPPRWRVAFVLVAVAALVAMVSCGGGGGGSSSNPGTPVGLDSNVVVTFSNAGVSPAPVLNLPINVE
jgi:hypothetical protein